MSIFKLAERLGFNPPFDFRIKNVNGRTYTILNYKNFFEAIIENRQKRKRYFFPRKSEYIFEYQHYIFNNKVHTEYLEIIIPVESGKVDLSEYNIGFDFDQSSEKVEFLISFPYADNNELNMIFRVTHGDTFQFLINVLGLSVPKSIRKTFLNALQNAKGDRDKLDWLYEIVPSYVIDTTSLEQLMVDLITLLDGSVNQTGTDEEYAVLKILTAMRGDTFFGFDENLDIAQSLSALKEYKNNASEFLNLLVSNTVTKPVSRGVTRTETVLKTLLNMMNDAFGDANFTTMLNFIWKTWSLTPYASFDSKENPLLFKLSENQGPLFLDYRSNNTLGFHSDNAKIKFIDKKINVDVNIGTGFFKEKTETTDDGDIFTYSEEITERHNYEYHPFAPVVILNADNPSFPYKAEEKSKYIILPAFILYAREDKAEWENIITGAEYLLDIVTTFSGIGNLLKVGRLYKALNTGKSLIDKTRKLKKVVIGVKAFAGTVEVSSGTVNILIKLMGEKETPLGRAISKYLFYLEILSLSGELTVALDAVIRKSAKDILDNHSKTLNILKKNAKNTDEAKQFDELIEHLDEVSRKKTTIKDLETLGKQGNKVVHILVDEKGKIIGELIRTSKSKRSISFKLKDVQFDNFSSKNNTQSLESEITLLNNQLGRSSDYQLPVDKGEEILYADLNIPKDITDELSGLGDLMLEDALLYFKNHKSFKNVDGIIGAWFKNPQYYKDYGGESINFTKFWKAVDEELTYEEAAFKTFTGDWAKNNQFTKVVIDLEDINEDGVIIKFINQ